MFFGLTCDVVDKIKTSFFTKYFYSLTGVILLPVCFVFEVKFWLLCVDVKLTA